MSDDKLPGLTQLVEWVDEWEEQTATARKLMANDGDYYHGKQWTQAEIETLKQRRQPVITKNKIARKVNAILGDEVEKRIDPVVRPRNPQHEDDARVATDALRYIEEEQQFDKARSRVFLDMMVYGVGGAIVEGPDTDETGAVDPMSPCAPLNTVHWDRLIWDPKSRESDFSDARYTGSIIWMDLDDAVDAYPDSQDEIESAVNNDSYSGSSTDEDRPKTWSDGKRRRVKICELYFRKGRDYYRACFTKAALLKPVEPTGYLDETGRYNVNPLVIASCYVDDDNNRYGIVRQLISPQDEINKRSSKALHLLNVNGVIAERDSVNDPQKFQTELAKPDGYAEVNPGALTDGRLQIRSGAEMAMGQFQLLQEAKQDIDSIGPSANIGNMPESTSGIALVTRQKAASKELAPVFDNLNNWDHAVFKQDWLRIRQFKTDEWWMRVTDDNELTGYRFSALNQRITRGERFAELLQKGAPVPKALDSAAGQFASVILQQAGQVHQAQMAQLGPQAQQIPQEQHDKMLQQIIMQHPLMQEIMVVNDVAQMQVDILIDSQPESTVITDMQFDKLTELAGVMAQMGKPMPVEMIIQASRLPDKRKLLDLLQKQSQPDPQQAALQQQVAQLQTALTQAQVLVAQSQAELNKARAANEMAQAQTVIPKAQADIQESQSKSMSNAANAGSKTGGIL